MTSENRLHTNNIFDMMRAKVLEAKDSILIMSPFINPDAIRELIEGSEISDVIIVTSWRPDYLLSGVSDPSLYEICRARGWSLLINNRLHAKIYLFDNCNMVLGSANCTYVGLGKGSRNNLEAVVCIHPLEEELSRVMRFVDQSMVVTDSMYNHVLEWLKNQPKPVPLKVNGYLCFESGDSKESLPDSKSPETLWRFVNGLEIEDSEDIGSFRDSNKYCVSSDDSYKDFLESMRGVFDGISLFKEFREFIDESDNGRRFGECRSWFKNITQDEADINEYTRRMYSWLTGLYPQYKVWIPNHTEVIYNSDLLLLGPDGLSPRKYRRCFRQYYNQVLYVES